MNTITIKSTFESNYLQKDSISKYNIISEREISEEYKLIYKCYLDQIDDVESFANTWAKDYKKWLNTINNCPSYTVNMNINNINNLNKTMKVSFKVKY